MAARAGKKTAGGSRLVGVDFLTDALGCSRKTVARLVRAGRVPPPARFGQLARWPKEQLEGWIAAGCPPVRPPAPDTTERT